MAVRWLARAGLLARGVVYGVIGILAVELALRTGGQAASQRGALERIGHEPFGQVLLIAIAIGLGGYALWRLIDGLAGLNRDHGLLERGAAIASGLAYAALCFTAIKILAGASTTGGANNPKRAAAGVLGWPGGPVIVGAVGVALIGVGIYQAYDGLSRKFLKDSRTGEMSEPTRRSFAALGVFGHCARAVVFALIGYGLIKAALEYAPRKAIGLDGALESLSRSAAGPLVLGVVALGFVGFGLYSIADARYRKL